MSRSGRPYPPEFRRQMVELVHAGRSPEELAREFEPTAQSIRNWVAQAARDIGCGDGEDAFSRRIVGWSMATTLATQLVLDALNMALATRRPRSVIHHSDQGSPIHLESSLTPDPVSSKMPTTWYPARPANAVRPRSWRAQD
jgi:transposase-like protein